jgi:hypothetical protein
MLKNVEMFFIHVFFGESATYFIQVVQDKRLQDKKIVKCNPFITPRYLCAACLFLIR